MGKQTSRKNGILRHNRPLVVLSWRAERQFGGPGPIGEAIAEQARVFGWDLLDLRFTRGALPEHRQPAGALIEQLPTDPLARELRKMGCPAVRIGRLPHPRDELLPVVLPDVVATGRLAARHFAERQFHHVGYVGRTPWSMSRRLYEAFREAAGEMNCTCHLLRLPEQGGLGGAALYEARAREVGAWLAELPKPVGVVAFNDVAGASLCTMCTRAGLTVPEDVAVLGFGNSELDCIVAPVDLSSIDPAFDVQGRRAARLLERLMRGRPAPAAPVRVPPRGVVTRRSTDVLAVPDPVVARAMRFMWDHLDQNLSVDDVAEEVGASRRQLERAFRSHLKRGINAELRRKRLERCCELLRSTNHSVTDIAPMVGFRSDDFLHASFKQAFGITPRQYRLGTRRAD